MANSYLKMDDEGKWYKYYPDSEIQCSICLDDFLIKDIVDCKSCKMKFCMDCIKKHIKMNVFSKVEDVDEEERKKIIKNNGNLPCPNQLCVGLFKKSNQKFLKSRDRNKLEIDLIFKDNKRIELAHVKIINEYHRQQMIYDLKI